MGVLSLRISERRGGWTTWAGCPGPGGRVQQETPGHGSCGPVFGEPRLPRPFESAGLLGALVGAPKAPVGVESGLCGPWAAPRRHFGGRNHAFGSQHGTCASEGPSGLTLLPPTSSLLHSLCSRGRWAGAGCVPLGAGPGSPSEPCTWKPALLTCPAGWGRSEEITVPTSAPGVPCDLRRFGVSESCPRRDPGSPGLQQTSFLSPGRPWPPARSADGTRAWRREQHQAGSHAP